MGDEKGDQSMFHMALKSLCCSYRWSYGVFWHFNPQNSLLLTMEESYCEVQMGTIVDNMLLQVHMIGYGLVGQVAFTKRHRWMFSDDHYGQRDIVASVEHLFSLEDDSDVHTQFSSGIKTIVLIYVESLGVIQFGSTLKIPETSEFVDHTTRLFQETKELETFFLAEITPSASEIDGRSYGIYSFTGNGDSALGSLENYSPNLPLLSPFTSDNGTEASSHLVNHQLQMAMEGASFESSNESLPEPFLNPTINVNDSTASSPCIISTCVSSLQSSMSSTIPYTLHAPFQETSLTTPQLETYPLEVSSLSSILSHPSDSVQSSLLDEFPFDDSDNCLNEICAETDLFDDLGIDFDFGEDGNFLDDILSPVVGGDHLGFSSEYTSVQHNWMNNLGLDHLLDGITGNSRSSFEDELHLAKRGNMNTSGSVIRESFEPGRVLERKKVMDSVVGPSHNMSRRSSDVPVCKSSQKSFKSASNRKKGKKGSRPKSPDRVVIDACISELRKLIPNGSKMSIVSLLEQTAKHAVFLQSMTKHAEKLKRAAGGGDKWLWQEYEVVNADPVQVRDLRRLPGHKLIQVMMEESGGCCLEMVDVVQGLGLSILKGVMEVKEKKLRAYFVVEAQRNMVVVSNQQIYMSLRQLVVHHKAAATAACDEEQQEVIASDNFFIKQEPCYIICLKSNPTM